MAESRKLTHLKPALIISFYEEYSQFFFYHKQAFVTKKRKIVYLSALTDVLFQTTPPQTGSMEQAQAQAKLETPAFGEGAGMVGREK